MKILLVIAFGILFLTTCGQREKKKIAENFAEPQQIGFILDTLLIEEIYKFVKVYKKPEYDFPFSESCMVIRFIDNNENTKMFFSDTIAIVSYNICNYKFDIDAYKGVIKLDTINVAIFDENNIGTKYYNADGLFFMPFDDFKCMKSKIVTQGIFYVKENRLNYWCP